MNSTTVLKSSTTPPPPSVADAAASSGAKLRHAGIVAALIVVVGLAAGLIPRWHHRVALREETRELAIQTVAVVSPAPGTAAAGLTLPAEVKPLLEAPIYARASGYLKRWLVDIGAQVKEGQLLAEIDAPELNQELAQARAQLNQAEATLSLAKTTAARWTDLLKTASVSEQEDAEKQADLQLKSAMVEAARSNVRRLEDLQGFEKVTAPFSGIITARNIDVGQLIAAGSNRELFRLAQTGTLRIYARVPQNAAHSVVPGQMAELLLPEAPGQAFPAKVVRTAGAVSADSRTLLVELAVDNPRGEILAGGYAQVRFTEAKPDATLTLPSNTLLFRSEGLQVGVVGSDQKVVLKSITIGRDFGPTVEVLNGVSAADRVILNPSDSLVTGATVRLAEASNGQQKP
jgi:RND family efflux transporter MFP subunit